MSTWRICLAVERDPEKVSGAWVFSGTRVPVASLFENLRDGATIDQFLDGFPGVERWQVESVLDHETPGSEGHGGLRILFDQGVPGAPAQASVRTRGGYHLRARLVEPRQRCIARPRRVGWLPKPGNNGSESPSSTKPRWQTTGDRGIAGRVMTAHRTTR